MAKGANFRIAKKPGNLRDRQISIGKIAMGQERSQLLRNLGKRQILESQSPRHRTRTHAKSRRDHIGARLSVRQKFGGDIFHPFPEWAGFSFSAREALLTVPHQELMEMLIGRHRREIPARQRELDFVYAGLSLDVVPYEFCQIIFLESSAFGSDFQATLSAIFQRLPVRREAVGAFWGSEANISWTSRLTINCDKGERFGLYRLGNDAAMIPLIDLANVAYGFHASDP